MDNKQNIASPDRDRVNVHENYEVEYWAKRFDVTPQRLKETVAAVGTSSADVEKYLKK